MAPYLTRPLSILEDWRDKPIAGVRRVRVKDMPEDLFGEVHERQAQRNHGQSLERLNARGGVSAQECLCILACMPVTSALIHLPHEEAHRILYAVRASFRTGGLDSASPEHFHGAEA